MTGVFVEIMGTRAFQDSITGMCPFLTARGCGVYDRRPFMCRIFGASADPVLTCPEGVCSEKPLSTRATSALTGRYREMPPE